MGLTHSHYCSDKKTEMAFGVVIKLKSFQIGQLQKFFQNNEDIDLMKDICHILFGIFC